MHEDEQDKDYVTEQKIKRVMHRIWLMVIIVVAVLAIFFVVYMYQTSLDDVLNSDSDNDTTQVTKVYIDEGDSSATTTTTTTETTVTTVTTVSTEVTE